MSARFSRCRHFLVTGPASESLMEQTEQQNAGIHNCHAVIFLLMH